MAPRRKKDSSRRGNPDTPSLELTPDELILQEAEDRFKRCEDWESEPQQLYVDDVKFANGDSDNGWQWPRDLQQERENNSRPSLTINKVAPKVALIVNDMRQNKPGMMVRPVGEATSFEASQCIEAVLRHIEYASKAQTIYDEAAQSAVEGGIGWWRVGTRYCGPDTFDQEIVILPVRNHLAIYLDPDIQQPDGSDAKFGFAFEDMQKDDAHALYPDADLSPNQLSGPSTWVNDTQARVAEYFRIKEIADQLVYMEDQEGNGETFLRSDVPGKWAKLIDQAEKEGHHQLKKRDVRRKQLEWFKIVGHSIVERRDGDDCLPGQYVPLVRTIGIERIIDGKLHRRGHVRALKDPQRMYNYNSSGQVEFGALATKTPYIGDRRAFEGNEEQWSEANTKNLPYLGYNGWDDATNQTVPAPQRAEPPGTSPAFLNGMQIAEHEMDIASGQYEASDGRQGNERSGKAIAERQRQGETANYHFIDHQARAIVFTGMIILDMLPHYYDTERVIQMMGRDGTQSTIKIDPEQTEAVKQLEKDKNAITMVLNPKIGKYMVEADTGPSFATARQEAWNAFVQITSANGDLINEIGDLMFRSADFPLADKIAERLNRRIRAEKPYLFDDNAPTPMMQQLQQQAQELQQQVQDYSSQVAELLQQLAEKNLKLVGKEQKRDIDAYKAESDRITALSNAYPELKHLGILDELDGLLSQTLEQMRGLDITKVVQNLGGEGTPGGADQPTSMLDQLGAQQAPDGHHYIAHPDTGQPMRVDSIEGTSQ